jgi:PRC-barrel domain protein
MDARRGIAKGMTVFTREGEKLGKVVSVDDKGLFVEKGLFFPKEFGFPFDDVDEVRQDGVHLRLDREAAAHAIR